MGVVCTKCGATATTKCPRCRNIFLDCGIEAALSHWLKVWDENGNDIRISARVFDGKTPLQTLEDMVTELRRMQDRVDHYPSLGQYLCDHEWAWQIGSKSRIDCGCPVPTVEPQLATTEV